MYGVAYVKGNFCVSTEVNGPCHIYGKLWPDGLVTIRKIEGSIWASTLADLLPRLTTWLRSVETEAASVLLD